MMKRTGSEDKQLDLAPHGASLPTQNFAANVRGTCWYLVGLVGSPYPQKKAQRRGACHAAEVLPVR